MIIGNNNMGKQGFVSNNRQMQEKINEEFVKKSWDIDYEEQKRLEAEEYKKHAIELIAKAVCRNDLREIKEFIKDEVSNMYEKVWNHSKIAFGGDYNPEQWDEETWKEDMRLSVTRCIITAFM